MNDTKKAGLWTLAVGIALLLAVFILISISRVNDPNGVPIGLFLIVPFGGVAVAVGVVVTLIGISKNKTRA